MLKKLLAGLSASALLLGVTAFSTLAGPALAASADGGSHSPAASGETCVEFTSAAITAGSPLTSGAITATFASPEAPWTVASSGNPLATIQVLSNGAWSARTGATTFSGDNGAAIDGAWICTAPAAQAAVQAPAPAPLAPATKPSPPYVIAAWLMPSWSPNGTWPQTYFTSVTSSTPNLGALDSQLTHCGASYQVDVYYNSAITTALIAGGYLTSPGVPNEDLLKPGGTNLSYKLVHNADCLPQDAAASVNVSTPTCLAQGYATFSLSHASWTDSTGPEDQTVGAHTRIAQATSGHLFSNGLNTISVTYTIPGTFDASGPECYFPVPVKPSYSAITGCGVYGSISLVNTAYITYAITHGDGKQGWNQVTATAVSPYTLARGSHSPWWINLGTYRDCYKPAVTWSLGSCTVVPPSTSVKDLAVLFDNTGSTTAVTFTIPSASISKTVAANTTSTVDVTVGTTGSPALKVYANGRLLATTDVVPAFDGCLPVTVVGDPASAATCAADGTVADGAVNVDFEPGVVDYTISGGALSAPIEAVGPSTALPPGTYTVTATAAPGYVLSGPSSWVQIIDDPSPCTPPCTTQLGTGLSTAALDIRGLDDDAPLGCDPPTLASWQTAVAVAQPRCAAAHGTLTVGDVGGGISFFSEVDYFLDGVQLTSATSSIAPGSYTVTASPHTAGDGLIGPSVFPITVVAASVACADLTTLALTGSNPFGGAALAMGLLMAGLVLVTIRLLRRPRSQG